MSGVTSVRIVGSTKAPGVVGTAAAGDHGRALVDASWICACRSLAACSLDSGASDVDGSLGSPGEKVENACLRPSTNGS